jgi:hypothetical protein
MSLGKKFISGWFWVLGLFCVFWCHGLVKQGFNGGLWIFFCQKQVENNFLKCKNHDPVFSDTMVTGF